MYVLGIALSVVALLGTIVAAVVHMRETQRELGSRLYEAWQEGEGEND